MATSIPIWSEALFEADLRDQPQHPGLIAKGKRTEWHGSSSAIESVDVAAMSHACDREPTAVIIPDDQHTILTDSN